MAEKTEDLSVSERLNDFIQKKRKILLISLAGVIGAVIVLAVVFTVRDHFRSQALSRAEELIRRFEAVRFYINSDDPEADSHKEELDVLMGDLALFQEKNSGYAAARAYAVSANVFEDQKNWAEAENAWLNAAQAGNKTYFAPVAFFNAAVAAEEQGNAVKAMEHYNKALEFEGVFPSAPRAQFAIARLQETQGDKSAALASYTALVGKWPQEQVWVNLAHSRILALSIEQ